MILEDKKAMLINLRRIIEHSQTNWNCAALFCKEKKKDYKTSQTMSLGHNGDTHLARSKYSMNTTYHWQAWQWGDDNLGLFCNQTGHLAVILDLMWKRQWTIGWNCNQSFLELCIKKMPENLNELRVHCKEEIAGVCSFRQCFSLVFIQH